MQKRKLTQEDLDNNPILPELGFKVGDEIGIPEANESNEASDSDDDEEGGGGNHPTDPSGKP